MENKDTDVFEKVKKETLKKLEEEITANKLNNVEIVYKLVDILKDLNQLEGKENEDMYRDYGEYGDNYGRRGVPGTGRRRYRRYRGDDMMEEMQDHYSRYMEGRSYGSPESDKAFKYMVKTYEDFGMHIGEIAETPEQKEMLCRASEKVSRNV